MVISNYPEMCRRFENHQWAEAEKAVKRLIRSGDRQ